MQQPSHKGWFTNLDDKDFYKYTYTLSCNAYRRNKKQVSDAELNVPKGSVSLLINHAREA